MIERREISHSKRRLTVDHFVAIVLIFWTILNLIQGAFTELSADEAYYYIISQYPSWGYFDHPPMNMWLIFLSTHIFDNSEFGIRCLTILLQPIYLYLFWLTIKTEKSKMSSAMTYLLLAISMPMLQVWGWISTPDSPLMLFSILLLWAYKNFIKSDRLVFAITMGISIALMGYSKYHGILFLAFLIMSNIRMLLSWKFWVGILVALVLFLPHLYWQYSNDWVSFMYHLSGRTSGFEWENLGVYIVNLLTTFNPFLIVVLIVFILRNSLPSQNEVAHAMKWIMWGFVLFFLWNVFKVHVQAQWLILVSFPVIYFLFTASENRPYLRHYLHVVGFWMLGIFFVARMFLIFCPTGIVDFDMLGSKVAYKNFAEKLDSMPFIGNSHYQFVSKLEYYGKVKTYGRPSLDSRSSHFELLDLEDQFKGKTVAVEVSQYALDENRKLIQFPETIITKKKVTKLVNEPRKHVVSEVEYEKNTVNREYHRDVVLGDTIIWDTIQNYLPTEKIRINTGNFPIAINAADNIQTRFEIKNPYPYDIPIQGPYSYKLYMHVRYGRFSSFQFRINWPKGEKVIPAAKSSNPMDFGTLDFKCDLHFPSTVMSGIGTYGFSIGRLPFGSWYNSDRKVITITNAETVDEEKNRQIFINK